jgi:hypothetical protein
MLQSWRFWIALESLRATSAMCSASVVAPTGGEILGSAFRPN